MTDTDRQLLDLAGRRWPTDSHLEQAMVDATGLSPWRCWQALNALLSDPEAWAYAPLTCRALRDRQRGKAAHDV